MAGLHAIYNSSLFDLDVDMDSLKVKVSSIEPVVGKLNEEIKGMCAPRKVTGYDNSNIKKDFISYWNNRSERQLHFIISYCK